MLGFFSRLFGLSERRRHVNVLVPLIGYVRSLMAVLVAAGFARTVVENPEDPNARSADAFAKARSIPVTRDLLFFVHELVGFARAEFDELADLDFHGGAMYVMSEVFKEPVETFPDLMPELMETHDAAMEQLGRVEGNEEPDSDEFRLIHVIGVGKEAAEDFRRKLRADPKGEPVPSDDVSDAFARLFG